MKLTASERLIIQQLLPKESSRMTMRLVDEVSKKLPLTEAELEIVDYKILEDGREQWKPILLNSVPEVDIKLGHILRKIMLDSLKKMDADEKLPKDFLPIFDRFEALASKADDVEDAEPVAHEVKQFKKKAKQ